MITAVILLAVACVIFAALPRLTGWLVQKAFEHQRR